MKKQRSAQFSVKIEGQSVEIKLPALLESDTLTMAYQHTAIQIHALVIACPSLCGGYALLLPDGAMCSCCGHSKFPYLSTCMACGKLALRSNQDGERCYACGQFGSNLDGVVSSGNFKTGEYREHDTTALDRERYYER